MKNHYYLRLGGCFLMLLGCLHLSAMFHGEMLDGLLQLRPLFSHGLWNALAPRHNIGTNIIQFSGFASMFLCFGVMMVLFGGLCTWVELYLKKTIPIVILMSLLLLFSFLFIIHPMHPVNYNSNIFIILYDMTGSNTGMLITLYMILCKYLLRTEK